MTSGTVSSSSQLDAIYSMMEDGQHSVKIERHSLLIWGITAAILILITDLLFNPETIAVRWQLILSQTIFISTILFFAGYWDLKLTRKVRQLRDESISFIQLQLTKVWWFFVALIVLLNVGMNFFGGGYMFYGLTMALIGMAFYIQGLFSTQMLKWTGLMLILIGLASVALNLHFLATKWLAAGVFGLGLPMLAFILEKPSTHSTFLKRVFLSLVWFGVVIFPSMFAFQSESTFDATGLTERNLSEYKMLDAETAAEKQIIHFTAGTYIPVNINMGGNILEMDVSKNLVMKLTKDISVVIKDGKTVGHFKVAGSEWSNKPSQIQTKKFKMESAIEQEKGPYVNLDFSLQIK